MHDWWIALVASAFGIIDYVDQALVLYRQHDRNDTGAKRYSVGYFLGRAIKFRESIESNKKIIRQGKDFYSIYKDFLTSEQKEALYNFITLFESGRFERAFKIFKHKFFKYGILRNCGFVCVMLISNKDEKGFDEVTKKKFK